MLPLDENKLDEFLGSVEVEQEHDAFCQCKKGYDWEDISKGGTQFERVDVPQLVEELKEMNILPDGFLNITEAYIVHCDCKHQFLVAEIADAVEDRETGELSSGYMTLSLTPTINYTDEDDSEPNSSHLEGIDTYLDID